VVSKDQAIGGVMLLVCSLVAVLYIITLSYPKWLVTLGLLSASSNVQFWLIAVPVFVAFEVIMFIGTWIGWTMATTPPPKPIEERTIVGDEKELKE
jgi:predicted DNA-binding transcriptional regulator